MSLTLQFACKTDPGRIRDHNEDYVLAERPDDAIVLSAKGTLLVVADGMGGHQAGEVASEKAAQVVRRKYYGAGGSPDPARRLLWAVQVASLEVYQLARANPAQAGMGTTVVAAAVIGNQAHVASVGDSRAYLVRGNSITQITADHSLVAAQVEAGILTPEQARAHPQRNVVTRALGANPTVQVDMRSVALMPGDALVLCSDGLTEHVPDAVLLGVVSSHSAEQAADKLVELANAAGGSDNISVIVAQAERPSAQSGLPPLNRLYVAAIAAAVLLALVLITAGILVIGNALAQGAPTVLQEATLPAPAQTVTVEAIHVSPTATLRPTWTPEPSSSRLLTPANQTGISLLKILTTLIEQSVLPMACLAMTLMAADEYLRIG